jgi:hypothetical protein
MKLAWLLVGAITLLAAIVQTKEFNVDEAERLRLRYSNTSFFTLTHKRNKVTNFTFFIGLYLIFIKGHGKGHVLSCI